MLQDLRFVNLNTNIFNPLNFFILSESILFLLLLDHAADSHVAVSIIDNRQESDGERAQRVFLPTQSQRKQ